MSVSAWRTTLLRTLQKDSIGIEALSRKNHIATRKSACLASALTVEIVTHAFIRLITVPGKALGTAVGDEECIAYICA